MFKRSIRLFALLIAVIMLTVFCPYAGAVSSDTFEHGSDVVTAGCELDYGALLAGAYVVNPAWSGSLKSGATLVYSFRGETHTESYDSDRHFATFASAYAHFEAKYTKSGALQTGFARQTPVFVLAPGTYSESRMTVRAGAIILGSNAGVDPNAPLDFEHADPRAGWDAADRFDETVIEGGFALSQRVGTAATSKYEDVIAAAGAEKLSLIIDGVSFTAGASFVTVGEVASAAKRENYVCVQNSIVSPSASSVVINNADAAAGENVCEFYRIRSVGSKALGFIGVNTARAAVDGLYLAESGGSVSDQNVHYTAEDFTFNIQNSYLYKCNRWTPLAFRTENANRLKITVNGNILYESASGNYGALMFHTREAQAGSAHNVTFINNTVLFDKSYNTSCKAYTLFNGSPDYQKGAYYLYMRYNRIIGFVSMFPNLQDWNDTCTGDANYNYFAAEYHGYDDQLGGRSMYSSSSGYTNKEVAGVPYCDPFRVENLIYYEDYAKTVVSDCTLVTGVSFFDAADSVTINNSENTIHVLYSGSEPIEDPQLLFRHAGATAEFYSDRDCQKPITSIAAPSAGGVRVVYAMRRFGTVSKLMTVMVYGADAIPAFADAYVDPYGEIDSTAKLYYPLASGYASGTSITVEWRGEPYRFTVGSNAFGTLSQLYVKTGRNVVPQIIMPYGEYGDLNVTRASRIFGEDYYAPAAAGYGYSDWISGPGRQNERSSRVGEVTVGAPDVVVSGVVITGAVKDETRSAAGKVEFRNSIIESAGASSGYRQFSITNPSASRASNEYVLSGLWVKSMSADSDNGSKVLFGGTLPSSVTVSGCLFDGVTRLFGSSWNSTLYTSACSVDVVGCRFDGIAASGLITDLRDGLSTGGAAVTYSITDNAFFGSQSGDYAVAELTPDAYTALTFTDNYFINPANGGRILDCNYKNAAYSGAGVTCERNRAVGFTGGIGATGYVGDGSVIDFSYNYYAPYSDKYPGASDGVCPTGFAACRSYYKDFALTEAALPVAVEFADDPDLTVNGAKLTLNAAGTVDFCGDYMTVSDGGIVSAAYASSGAPADPHAIELTGAVTVVTLRVSVEGNDFSYSQFELRIIKDTDPSLLIDRVSSDRGYVVYDDSTGVYILELPDTAAGASVAVSVPSGTSWRLMKDGGPVSSVSSVEPGAVETYVIRVSGSAGYQDYVLLVRRHVSSGVGLDYDLLADTAYIVDPSWSGLSAGSTVRFFFRGVTRAQAYDPSRHFSSFQAAYDSWLASGPDIIHDTPVFILAAGTYGDITVNYRAIILGTNAGIDPNDPSADVSSFTPNDDVAENPQWDAENETVITGTLLRSTRISDGSSPYGYEKTVQDAEAGQDERMNFSLTVDGVKFSGSGACVRAQDVDAGSVSDGVVGTLNVIGRRPAAYAVQNVKADGVTQVFFTAADLSHNTNSVTVKNMRVTGMNADAVFGRVISELVMDGCYFTGSTLNVSLLNTGGNMSFDSDVHYVFKNNVFKNNTFIRAIRVLTSPGSGSTYTQGSVEIYGNAFIETAGAVWGVLSFSAANLPDMTYNVHDNLFSQTGGYNGVKLNTAVEGNVEFFVNEMNVSFFRNRVIGAATFLPNVQNLTNTNLQKTHLDFNENYLAPSFVSTRDVGGVQPEYYTYTGDSDPIDPASLTYYRDWNMQVLNTDFDITGVTFAGEPAQYVFDPAAKSVTVSLIHDAADALVFTTAGENVRTTLINPAGDPVSAVDFTSVLAGGRSYTLRLEKNGVAEEYAVTLNANGSFDFATEYSDPTGEIKNTAYALTLEAENRATGETVYLEWGGKTYSFVVGVNAFSATSRIQTVNSGKKQIIVPVGEYPDPIVIYKSTSLYGNNYAVDPNVKGADLSDDWEMNPEWGATGESGVGPLTVNGGANGTEILVKGVTMRDRFNDTERSDSTKNTRIVLENIVVDHPDWLPSNSVYTFYFNCAATASGSKAKDVGIMRNIRLKSIRCNSNVSGGQNRFLNERLPYDFTLEGVYIDGNASQCSWLGWWKISDARKDASLNIIKCNFRNAVKCNCNTLVAFEARDHKNNDWDAGQTLTLNLRGNCFFNAAGKTAIMSCSLYGYSRINITDNAFISSSDSKPVFSWSDTGDPVSEKPELNVYGNRFVGVSRAFNMPSGYSRTVDLSGNYCNSYTNDFKNAYTANALYGSSAVNNMYFSNYALTVRSDGLNYKFSDRVVKDALSGRLTITAGAGRDTFSLYDYIEETGGCTFSLTGADPSAVPAVSSAEYPLTVRNGELYDNWTLAVSITGVDLSELYTAIERAENTDTADFKTFIAERIEAAAAAGKTYVNDPHVTAAEAANAADRINLAIDAAERIVELEQLIAAARVIDLSSVSEEDGIALAAAINAAEAAANNSRSSPDDVEAQYVRLENTIEGLRVGLAQMVKAINDAEAIVNGDYAQYYTAASVAALSEALTAAKAADSGYGDTVGDAEFIAAKDALVAALAAVELDLSQLEAALGRLNAVNNDADVYCADSYSEFVQEREKIPALAENVSSGSDVGALIERIEAVLGIPVPHALGEFTYNNDADCENDGTETAFCLNHGCDYTVTRTKAGSALGHAWSGEVVSAPTCVRDGLMRYTCGNDSSHTYTEVIPADPDAHEFVVKSNAAGHWNECVNCGMKTEAAAHVFDGDSDTECDVCGFVRMGDPSEINPMSVCGTVFAGEAITVPVGGGESFDLAAQTVNGYGNVIRLYADEDTELEFEDLSDVYVAPAGAEYYLKVTSPDGTKEQVVPLKLTREAVRSVGVAGEDAGSGMLRWVGAVKDNGAGDFGADGDRLLAVGAAVFTTLNANYVDPGQIKTLIIENAENITAKAEAINKELSRTSVPARIHPVSAADAAVWNDARQAFSFSYEEAASARSKRYAMMYTVRRGADGALHVDFSEILAQTAK